jgi:hypothetical protein
VVDAGIYARLQGRQKVVSENPRTKHRLKPVPEGRIHEFDYFFTHCTFSLR